jgi:hypothetical protein
MSDLNNRVNLKIRVTIAWWLIPYFYVLASIAVLTGLEPNYDRVNYWINKAVKAKVSAT